MEHDQSRGYVKLGKAQTAANFQAARGCNHISPPLDKHNYIYVAMILAGIGFLLPYNTFIIAVDYFQAKYPDSTIVFDMSLVYILVSFFAVLANNVLVETLSLKTRIAFGYLISFVTLVFITTCEVWWELFGDDVSYYVNLMAVAVVALGCTIQQSSFYGYASMLPSRYTQAVMAGESFAGFLVSLNRIVTKIMLHNRQINTLLFFGISSIEVAACFGLHEVVQQSDFVQFYITLCKESKKVMLEPTEDANLMETLDQSDGGGEKWKNAVLKLQQTPSSTPSCAVGGDGKKQTLSFANPVYDPGNSSYATGPSYKVEDVLNVEIRGASASGGGGSGGGGFRVSNASQLWNSIKRGMALRWYITKNIWQYMLSICMAYFVTLSLYPGIISEIKPCQEDVWFPVFLMCLFNGSDLLGKIISSIKYEWLRSQLFIFACWRLMLIPFMVFCAAPRGKPLMSGEGYPMFFSILLGVTNGIVGSVPMIQAPRRVSEEHRELAGNIMTLSYNFGLTAGALAAYALEKILGESKFKSCLVQSAPIPSGETAITTSAAAIIATTFLPSALSEMKTTTTAAAATTAVPTTPATTVFTLLGAFFNSTNSTL